VHLARFAAVFDFANAGSSNAARMPMIKTTTSNSIKVKALQLPRLNLFSNRLIPFRDLSNEYGIAL
jgi:hypothetical protein